MPMNRKPRSTGNTSGQSKHEIKKRGLGVKVEDFIHIGWEETFDAALDIIAVISRDFRITKLNKVGCENIGKKQEELIGKKCFEIVHGLDSPIEGCPCQKALETGKGGKGEIFDHGRQYLATASPIRDGNNLIVALAHTVKDITELKEAEQELKKARDILEKRVEERTADLKETINRLNLEIEKRIRSEKALKNSEFKLQGQSEALERKNIALMELIEQIDKEKNRLKDEIAANIEAVIYPVLEKLKLEKDASGYVDSIRYHMDKLASTYGLEISSRNFQLTSRELEICNLIRSGLSSKEISKLSNISVKTVDKHRRNIRKKLGISSRRVNLTTFLREL